MSVDPATLSERRKLLIFGVMAFGQFMALLDIQIVAASLNSIQAGLNAGPDEIAWVQTSYLMAEIVMIPLAAFLSQALSTRWLFTLSAGLFTTSSLLCGLAWDINSMIAFRALQGFTGGAMVPLVFATGFVLFEGPKRAMVPAILGMVSTLAPTLGPTVGGLITEYVDWRWLFFMNIVPGVAVTLLFPLIGKVDAASPAMLRRIDWQHVASLAVFLGGLQYVLEEGPRHEWFNDEAVLAAAWVSFVGAVVFFERTFFSTMPVVKLTPFLRPTFVMACVLNVVIGFGLYAVTYLTPVYLGRVREFSSLQIGMTVFVTGIAMTVTAPIAARLSTRVDGRYVIAVGFAMFAVSQWMFSQVTPEWGFWELFWPQVMRGLAMLLCIVPAVGMALNGVPPDQLRYASGLFNLMRNLGGAVGIAVVNTWLIDFTRMHAASLSAALGEQPDRAREALAGLAQLAQAWTPDGARALQMAEAVMGRIVGREAVTLAFADAYVLMALLFAAALLIVPFAKPAPVEGPPPAEH
ncbi:DHA2 family efflux MFS transporter permease subunit [Phenylobacterium sp. SCN 70-31]|uniref:DHA2 family efflux MFS transporter permease subunit n=1 Tax=Phenylobacterium sp. SCN 70-31 TaxID=1660129 RepID=UPI00086C1F88|nr:DHA2 family efflux MFS transporter permease subunit [Phenylobacterium sp. SCN 70-31]ODT89613.1 MAG: MFS transporter [Phenylobacterium sp. SCN 70-31]